MDARNTRSYRGLNQCRQPRLATLAGVTSLAAGISTSLLRETRLASTAAGFPGFCQSQRHNPVAEVSRRKEKAEASPNRIVRAALKGEATGDDDMRDIRNDLQERADLAQDRIKAADVHFERTVERLRNEHDASVADLKASLAMIAKLMEFEERHTTNMSPDTTPLSSSQHANLAQKLRQVI